MSIFSNLIKFLAAKHINQAYKDGADFGKQEGRFSFFKEKEERLESDYNTTSRGKKVIYCSNEWQDPLFGWVMGTERVTLGNCLMVQVKSALNGEIHLCHPESLYFTDELLTLAILKLSPFERWNLSVCKLTHMRPMWTKSYPRQSVTPTDELEDKLRKSGFMFESYETSTWLSGRVNGRLSKFSERFYDYTYSAERYPNQSFIITVSLGPDVVAKLPVYSHLELEEFGKIVSKKIS